MVWGVGGSLICSTGQGKGMDGMHAFLRPGSKARTCGFNQNL
jgi:hypothetical protein